MTIGLGITVILYYYQGSGEDLNWNLEVIIVWIWMNKLKFNPNKTDENCFKSGDLICSCCGVCSLSQKASAHLEDAPGPRYDSMDKAAPIIVIHASVTFCLHHCSKFNMGQFLKHVQTFLIGES